MIKVFISHSHQDEKFVNQLLLRLNKDGIMTLANERRITISDTIADRITNAINNTDYFIIVLSKRSVNSKWVSFELSATIINEISIQENIILPILIDNCEIPLSLKGRIFADFRFSFEEGYQKLRGALIPKTTKQFHEILN
ncbi:toll/interleukin-1 receptor domain-containing protein [Mucilaginibacter sp.]|uniref:toll/interleukin-1 receptor domain-containing protein n=1 Tax=Mucilaginibacter sp. TaxID=1882438 RepID=UPI00261F6948|nr:toll/interleukin-1 receptor domain-containing protein [Mucilaginibacter sp.]MDB5126612.1 transrane sensor domain protein [Mucilaginibacter sp.]